MHVKRQKLQIRHFVIITIISIILMVVFSALSLKFDLKSNNKNLITDALFHHDPTNSEHLILTSRIARVLACLLVGSALSISGLISQLISKNALADPSILGVSDGSALAVTILYAFFPTTGMTGKILASIIGSLLAMLLIFGILKKLKLEASNTQLPLIGMIMGTIISSISLFLGSYFHISQVVTAWYNSRLYRIEMSSVQFAFLPLTLVIGACLLLSPKMNILSLGKDIATSLGLSVNKLIFVLIIITAIATGLSTAIVGRIAFVGLIVPHITKQIASNRYGWLVLLSGLFGALLVLMSDYFSRFINYPFETPVGVLIACIGAPFFLYLINRKGGTA